MLEFLDYLGTVAFALSGAIVAVEKEMDLVGILILSFITGFGGGILRDLLLGSVPPAVFHNYLYFILSSASAFFVFFFYKRIKALEKALTFADALGLGVFTVIGIEKALLFKMSYFNAIIMGVLTATFGGVIRDVLANRVPFIFRKQIYLTVCVLGALLFFPLKKLFPSWISVSVVIIFITVFRIVAYLKNWNLPRAKL